MKFLQQCKNFLQCLLLTAPLWSSYVCAQKLGRAPANFVPNDEVIFVPLEYETHFLVRNIDPKNPRLAQIKTQIEFWQNQQEYIQDWALENTGIYNPPTQDEKLNFFKRNFFRYVSKASREPLEQGLKDWWNANDSETEVQRVNQVVSDVNKKDVKGQTPKATQQKEIISAKQFKIKFRPQPFRGFAAFSLTSDYFNAESVMGINGRFDLSLSRNFASVGLNTSLYFDIAENRTIASLSKTITETISTSVTSTLAPDDQIKEDHRFSIRYFKSF